MLPAGHYIWRLSDSGDQALGLWCSEDGLYLGRTPLVERRGGWYAVRSQAELARLFRRAYGDCAALERRVLAGLVTAASALNDKNLPLAQIAALHLRLPDFPDLITWAKVEAEDRLVKSRQASDWDETEHPRAGTPPNPGWFAPKPTSDTQSRPMQTAEGRREEQEPEEILDPMAPMRQAVWDAHIALLRRIDPNNPNLTYFANPNSPPNQEALDRLDAEVAAVTARVANTIANGHAFARHAAEFPEVSGKSQFTGVIQRVISNPKSLVRSLTDDRTAFFEEATNSLVIVAPKRTDLGTAFRPSDGADYLNRLR